MHTNECQAQDRAVRHACRLIAREQAFTLGAAIAFLVSTSPFRPIRDDQAIDSVIAFALLAAATLLLTVVMFDARAGAPPHDAGECVNAASSRSCIDVYRQRVSRAAYGVMVGVGAVCTTFASTISVLAFTLPFIVGVSSMVVGLYGMHRATMRMNDVRARDDG